MPELEMADKEGRGGLCRSLCVTSQSGIKNNRWTWGFLLLLVIQKAKALKPLLYAVESDVHYSGIKESVMGVEAVVRLVKQLKKKIWLL